MSALTRIGDYLVEQAIDDRTYLATHVVLPRRARITISSREDAALTLREACIVEALRHPGVPRVYECGLLADKRAWLAVERVDGEALGRLSTAGVVALVRDLAEILDHAHRRGVVHGNLRAETIVKASPRRGFPICLLDWGRTHVGEAVADDLRALGAIVAPYAHGAPSRLAALIVRMCAGTPSAATVHAEAAKLAELVDAPAILDETDLEPEDVVLVDIIPEPIKLRWTPALGSPTPVGGTPIASLFKRGPR